jgi:hypothetical protein
MAKTGWYAGKLKRMRAFWADGGVKYAAGRLNKALIAEQGLPSDRTAARCIQSVKTPSGYTPGIASGQEIPIANRRPCRIADWKRTKHVVCQIILFAHCQEKRPDSARPSEEGFYNKKPFLL